MPISKTVVLLGGSILAAVALVILILCLSQSDTTATGMTAAAPDPPEFPPLMGPWEVTEGLPVFAKRFEIEIRGNFKVRWIGQATLQQQELNGQNYDYKRNAGDFVGTPRGNVYAIVVGNELLLREGGPSGKILNRARRIDITGDWLVDDPSSFFGKKFAITGNPKAYTLTWLDAAGKKQTAKGKKDYPLDIFAGFESPLFDTLFHNIGAYIAPGVLNGNHLILQGGNDHIGITHAHRA